MSVSFGVQPRHLSPLHRKIEALVAAREAERTKAAAGVEAQRRASEARRSAERAAKLAERRENIRWRAHPKRRTRAMEARFARWSYQSKKRVTAALIIAEVAAEYDLSSEDICSPCKLRRYLTPRYKAMWRIFSETSLSLPMIGQRMGGRDHTTIIHGIRHYMQENGLAFPEHRRRLSKYGYEPRREGPGSE